MVIQNLTLPSAFNPQKEYTPEPSKEEQSQKLRRLHEPRLNGPKSGESSLMATCGTAGEVEPTAGEVEPVPQKGSPEEQGVAPACESQTSDADTKSVSRAQPMKTALRQGRRGSAIANQAFFAVQEAAVRAVAKKHNEKRLTKRRTLLLRDLEEDDPDKHEAKLRKHESYKFDGEQSKLHFERRVRLGRAYWIRLRISTEILVVAIGMFLGGLAALMNLSIANLHKGGADPPFSTLIRMDHSLTSTVGAAGIEATWKWGCCRHIHRSAVVLYAKVNLCSLGPLPTHQWAHTHPRILSPLTTTTLLRACIVMSLVKSAMWPEGTDAPGALPSKGAAFLTYLGTNLLLVVGAALLTRWVRSLSCRTLLSTRQCIAINSHALLQRRHCCAVRCPAKPYSCPGANGCKLWHTTDEVFPQRDARQGWLARVEHLHRKDHRHYPHRHD